MDMHLLVSHLHSTTRGLPWNNLDELSCLWAVFTKCKRQLRNGFRLENLTWRLWYRQAVMRKRTAPVIANEPDLTPVASTRLSRSRSLPDLATHYAKQTCAPSFQVPTTTPPTDKPAASATNKFYIDLDSSEDDSDDADDDTVISSIDNYWVSTACSSAPSSIMSMDDESPSSPPLFAKQDLRPTSAASASTASTSKPMSLLSLMLQQQHQQQHQPQSASPAPTTDGCLRRCNRFGRLDEWFAGANA